MRRPGRRSHRRALLAGLALGLLAGARPGAAEPDPSWETAPAADALAAYLEATTGTRIGRPEREAGADWFLGFERELAEPSAWRPMAMAVWEGSTDLAWVLVTPRSRAARPRPGGVGPDLPMETGADRIRVPSSEDALFGAVYGALASAAVPLRLFEAARSQGKTLGERLETLRLTGVRFGLFRREGVPVEPMGRLGAALAGLPENPRGDALLARLGADGFAPAEVQLPMPAPAPGPGPAPVPAPGPDRTGTDP